MKRIACLIAAWALLISLLSANADAIGACAPAGNYQTLADSAGGIGGTGHASTPDGGIGGTGRANEPGNEGGIGGTGIVGTITGFASICVNGLEVHYSDTVPVSENGQPTTTRSLAIGQLVAVEAGNSARGLEARRIAMLHALEGPVTRPFDQSGTFEVMGARVNTHAGLAREQAQTLKAGDWVQVSGHPASDDSVTASRVARIETKREASVSGLADPDRQRIGGVAVDVKSSGDLTIRGSWDGQRLIVRDSKPAAGTEWSRQTGVVVIETRVRQRNGNQIRTGRSDIDKALSERKGRDDDGLNEGALIRVTARVDSDGKLRPIRIERASRGRNEARNDTMRGKDDGNDRDDDRAGKDIQKASEKQEKALERAQRKERDAAEKNDRVERNDRTEKIERPERVERSGRDH